MTERPALSAGYLAWFDYAEKLERELLQAEQREKELRPIVERLAYLGTALILREYEPGSQAVTDLVHDARAALAVPEPTEPPPPNEELRARHQEGKNLAWSTPAVEEAPEL